jgi:Cytidylate kinase-like family
MSFDVVCISRAMGALGEEVGHIVAYELGYRYVDEEIVAQAAERGGVDPTAVADAETRKSLLNRLLSELGEGGSAEAYAYVGLVPSMAAEASPSGDLRALIREAVRETAAEGRVVIVAHAASYELAGVPGVLRALITASPEVRAERLGKQLSLDGKGAQKAVRDSDRDRADYLKRFHEVDNELPTHYDLVFSTDALAPSQVAEIIVAAAS